MEKDKRDRVREIFNELKQSNPEAAGLLDSASEDFDIQDEIEETDKKTNSMGRRMKMRRDLLKKYKNAYPM